MLVYMRCDEFTHELFKLSPQRTAMITVVQRPIHLLAVLLEAFTSLPFRVHGLVQPSQASFSYTWFRTRDHVHYSLFQAKNGSIKIKHRFGLQFLEALRFQCRLHGRVTTALKCSERCPALLLFQLLQRQVALGCSLCTPKSFCPALELFLVLELTQPVSVAVDCTARRRT